MQSTQLDEVNLIVTPERGRRIVEVSGFRHRVTLPAIPALPSLFVRPVSYENDETK